MLNQPIDAKVVRVSVAVAVLCALALSAVGCGGGTQNAAPQVAQERQKWEYKTLALANVMVGPFGQSLCPTDDICLAEDGLTETTMKLHELGSAGWELVGFVHNPGEIEAVFIFKRPAQ